MWLFGLYTSHNQWIENEVTLLTTVVDTNYQGGMGCCYISNIKKTMSGTQEISQGSLLALPWPILKVTVKWQQPIKRQDFWVLRSFENEELGHTTRKVTQFTEVMAVSRENIKCVIRKNVIYINCSITTKSGTKECNSFLHFLLALYFHVFLCVHCYFLLPSPHIILYTTWERLTLEFSLRITEFSVEFPLNFRSN